MIRKILKVVSILILPLIFSLLIYIQMNQITKTKEQFHAVEGHVESFGTTTKTHKGGQRSPKTESEIFYIKLKNNETTFSYFNRNENEYVRLKEKIKSDDIIKIFNEGYNTSQNTVDIIQLENNYEVLIDKSEFDYNACILLVLFSVFLILYFYIPYKYIYLKSKKQ
jgi:hypothetical protein